MGAGRASLHKRTTPAVRDAIRRTTAGLPYLSLTAPSSDSCMAFFEKVATHW
jgi:hypothetical protein